MTYETLQFHPKQYYKLEEPLKIYVNVGYPRNGDDSKSAAKVTPEQYKTLREALAKRKIPLIFSARPYRTNNGNYWAYHLQMPFFSLRINEGSGSNINLAASNFRESENGRNPYYSRRTDPMFLLEAAKGIYLVHQSESFFISPQEGTCEKVSSEEHLDWDMDSKAYRGMISAMESYFGGDDEYVLSPHVSDKMRENVLEPFEQYTEKEHEFELRQVDFTKGVKYTDWEAGRVSSGKKASFILYSCDPSADPEDCILAVGQRVVIYRNDQSSTGLVGLLVEIDTESRDGVLFTLEFYRQFDTDMLPKAGYLFVHQNDTQRKIRKAVSRSIHIGKTPAHYMYKTFHDYSVRGYEPLEEHPLLVSFLHQRMGQQYPPNQMQLEAIVKGIMTEDMLLVLGPPGTGKTTVIVSWVEYYISQGKRVLVSSQNNSAVDNVLERLGENKNCEIVRLGREEKIQENCKRFIPSRRIETMRNACTENQARLLDQIERDRKQIDAYVNALQSLLTMLAKRDALIRNMQETSRAMTQYAQTVASCHDAVLRIRNELDGYRSKNERYGIFLEESLKKNVFIRLLQAPLRRFAKKRMRKGQIFIEENELRLSQEEQEYAKAVGLIASLLKQVRQSSLMSQYSQVIALISDLHKQILKGTEDTPRLVPVFESELRYLTYTRQLRPDLNDPNFVQSELDRMESVRISAEKILEASRHWVETALQTDRNDIFEEILLDACQVVGATCIGINANKQFADVDFDVTIIDESGQIQLHNALVPMSRAPKTLMLGDYKQIPPIVNDEIVASCENDEIRTDLFKQSFFEFLFRQMRERETKRLLDNAKKWLTPGQDDTEETPTQLAQKKLLQPVADTYEGKPIEHKYLDEDGTEYSRYSSRYTPEQVEELIQKITNDRKKIVNLNSQFRMPGNISDVISEWFYESNYFSSYDMKNFKNVVPHTDLPLVLVDTSALHNRFESQPESKMGYQNTAEADLVADILEAVLQGMSEEEQLKYRQALGKRLGIISAYGAQVRHIRQKLCSRLDFSNTEASTCVASLDSFQGQERDLIIYSLTRSDRKNPTAARVGFLKELRRLNVAFTRCKKQLVIIGDFSYLQSCLYVKDDAQEEPMPCVNTEDNVIEQLHINQCAVCERDCERRFSRFFKLLMQHVQADPPAGNLLDAAQFKQILKGGHSNDS